MNEECLICKAPLAKEAWGLDDPTGKSDEEFIKTANLIKEKVLNLMR